MNRRQLSGWLAGMFLLLALGACHSAKSILLTEREEFALAQEYMKVEDWEKAREHFQRLSDRFPGSALASEAILGKAESYFLAKDYPEAKAEYQLFLEFYPAHEKADLALYRIGLANARGLRSPDRDQTATVEVIDTYKRFLEAHPNSPYAAEAQQRLVEAQQRLKTHDAYVARFYERRNVYLGAAVRYRKILDSYPLSDEERQLYQSELAQAWDRFTDRRLERVARDFEAGRWFAIVESVHLLNHYRPDRQPDEKALYYFAEALYQLDRHPEAMAEFERLEQTFPNSAFVRQARERISALQAERAPETLIEGEVR